MQIDFTEGLSKGQIVYDRLAKLQNQILDTPDEEVEVHFLNLGSVGRTFTFIIGCLPLLGKQHQKTVRLFLPPRIMKHMEYMDIYDYYSNPATKFQRFQHIENNSEDVASLVLGIVKDAPITMSEGLKELLVSKIGEMYNNAFEHSKATYVLGGKYFKSRGLYCFSCYDTGIGICKNVRTFLDEPITDPEALEWAIKPQNTTNPEYSRGLGLSVLLEFAKVNKGEIRICTGNVLFTFSERGCK
jgi:hypothetical protein